jgi:hypothetical protein
MNDWLPLEEFVKRHPVFDIKKLRWFRTNSELNNFNMCVKKIGRRIYISPRLFWKWFNETEWEGGNIYQK